ncbi:CHASE3 domain-containing protein, partial [Candidatus Contendibacter odensensis]|uniref:CHASE3 domain-containing protein n=1 Tax=Candidatus Contendibacter odensensis TaxID=1400860 RepID=UPI000558B5ED
MKSLSLRMQIFVSIIIPLALMIVVGLLAIQGINKNIAANKMVEHTYAVLNEAASILSSAVDMETGMRGYLLAGKEEFLDPYKSGEKAIYAKIDSLKNTVSDNPKQVGRLTEIEKTLREWQEKDTTPSISLRREVGNAKTMDDIARRVGEGHGKQYFDKFRQLIANFNDEETQLLGIRKEADKAAISNLFTLIYSAILVAIVLSLGVGWYMVRRIFSQVGGEPAAIAVLTQQIAEGNLTVRFTDTGKETGIYATMREMTGQLKGIVSQVTQATAQVSSAAAEIAQGSSDLSQRTEEQAS